MTEWICESCVHYPPEPYGGKPCAAKDTTECPLRNYYKEKAEKH